MIDKYTELLADFETLQEEKMHSRRLPKALPKSYCQYRNCLYSFVKDNFQDIWIYQLMLFENRIPIESGINQCHRSLQDMYNISDLLRRTRFSGLDSFSSVPTWTSRPQRAKCFIVSGVIFTHSSRESKVKAVSSAYYEYEMGISISPVVFGLRPVSWKSALHRTTIPYT